MPLRFMSIPSKVKNLAQFTINCFLKKVYNKL